MSTPTGLLEITQTQLYGTAVVTSGTVEAPAAAVRDLFVANGAGNAIDKFCLDLSGEAGTYNSSTPPTNVGGGLLTLSGSTAQTISLTSVSTAFASYAGNSLASACNQLILQNIGTQDVTIQPASSNGFVGWSLVNGHALTIRKGSAIVFTSAAGETVSSSATGLTVTPTSGGSLLVAWGGT
jgi:hypothetical protein